MSNLLAHETATAASALAGIRITSQTPSAVTRQAKPSPEFAHKLAASAALLTDANALYGPLVQASSLGAEDMVVSELLHRLAQSSQQPQVPIFVLDTGLLHPQTLALIAQVEQRYGLQVARWQPDAQAASDFVQQNGPLAMRSSLELRKACCAIRKMQPLGRALAGYSGWITGLRREQSTGRAQLESLEIEVTAPLSPATAPGQRVKLNPLADWTWGDVWHFIALYQTPYNPLHDAFYPSIGCEPCTRPISMGEDLRAGRWWWEQSDDGTGSGGNQECGLHVRVG